MANLSNINNKFLVTTGGNVGIGVTGPLYRLEASSSDFNFVGKFQATGTGYAPASILLETTGSASRGQGMYHYNTNADENWFTGVPYNVNSKKWIVANQYSTSQLVDTAQLTHALMTIDSDTGNVGIGTDSPSRNLDIEGTGDVYISVVTDATGTSGILLGDVNADYLGRIEYANSTNKLYLYSNNTLSQTIDASGNVGIGTTLPIGKFNVSKDSTTDGLSQAITVSSSSVSTKRMNLGYVPGSNYAFIDVINYAISNTNQALSLQPNGGNVGINETNPGSKLQINTSDERGTMLNSTVADKLIYSQINANSSTASTITGAAAIELVGQANASGHGRHAWIGAEGTSNTTFETKLKFKLRGETASGYDWAGSAEAPTIMTLEGSGNVGIGTTAPTSQLFVNNTADGDKIRWGRSDALVGSVGTFNGVPYIGYQGGAGGGIMFNGSSIEPTLLGSSRSSNTNDIGSVNYKWRNAYFGNQVSAANYIAAAAEGLRINDSAAYVSGYNTAGTQRTGYLQFLNGSGTILIDSEIGNRYIVMALASTAKVGIGTSSPLNKLQVNGDIGIGEINSTRSTNVRFAKNDVNVITFDISVGAVGAWRPGSCWIQVSGAQNGLQEYWSAWYFIRLTHYYLSGVAGQGTPNPSCILDSGGDTSSVDVGVSSTNTSNPQIITITLTDSGGTTNSMVADINCTMQMGINSIT